MENVENIETTETTETAKTYTEDEVMALIQAESDKRVTQALKTQEKKFQKQMSLSQMDEQSRAQAEKDDRIAELEQKLAEYTIEKNKSELKSTLSARGLDAQFADLLGITDDTEHNQKLIADFDKLFKKAVAKEVESRINGGSLKGNGTNMPETMTKDSFNKMSLAQQQTYLNQHPEFKHELM